MQIRIMGSEAELQAAIEYYTSLRGSENIRYVEISRLYPNRGNSTLYRLYVTVSYTDGYFDDSQATAKKSNQLVRGKKH